MAGLAVRESVTLAGRAERARVARSFVGGALGPKRPQDRLHRDARSGPARERSSTDDHRRYRRFRPPGPPRCGENLPARGVPAAQIAAALQAEQDREAVAIPFVVAASGIAIGQ
jgi:hypothetical protein